MALETESPNENLVYNGNYSNLIENGQILLLNEPLMIYTQENIDNDCAIVLDPISDENSQNLNLPEIIFDGNYFQFENVQSNNFQHDFDIHENFQYIDERQQVDDGLAVLEILCNNNSSTLDQPEFVDVSKLTETEKFITPQDNDVLSISDDDDVVFVREYKENECETTGKVTEGDVKFKKDNNGIRRNPIRKVRTRSRDLCKELLFEEDFAFLDTTSDEGDEEEKENKLFQKQAVLQGIADIFNSPSSSQEAVAAAGNKMFLALYNGPRKQTSLNMYRYNAFTKSVSNAKPDLSALPPTEGAARQHAFRVYHQIQFWLRNELPPVQWGWKVESNRLIPVTTEDPAAPEAVLNLVRCTCTTGCGNRCGYRKAGIMCTSICHNCHGECLNGVTSNLEEDFDDPDDPDVINLEEADHSVQITNTEHLVHKGQSNVLAGTRSQAPIRKSPNDTTLKQWPVNAHERPEYNTITKKIEAFDYTIREIQKKAPKKPKIETVKRKSKKKYFTRKRKPRVVEVKKIPIENLKPLVNSTTQLLKDFFISAKEARELMSEHLRNNSKMCNLENKSEILKNQTILFSIVNGLDQREVEKKLQELNFTESEAKA